MRWRIERALKLVHLESFEYYDGGSRRQSSDLAKSTLEWFLYGRGRFIDGLTIEDVRYNYGNTRLKKIKVNKPFVISLRIKSKISLERNLAW